MPFHDFHEDDGLDALPAETELAQRRRSHEATLVLKDRKLDELRSQVSHLRRDHRKRSLGRLVGWGLAGALACALGIGLALAFARSQREIERTQPRQAAVIAPQRLAEAQDESVEKQLAAPAAEAAPAATKVEAEPAEADEPAPAEAESEPAESAATEVEPTESAATEAATVESEELEFVEPEEEQQEASADSELRPVRFDDVAR